jgi:NADH:ubiquinone oxidoreductase subunit E
MDFNQFMGIVTESKVDKEVKNLPESDAKDLLIAYVKGVQEIEAYLKDKRLDQDQRVKAIKRIIEDRLQW